MTCRLFGREKKKKNPSTRARKTNICRQRLSTLLYGNVVCNISIHYEYYLLSGRRRRPRNASTIIFFIYV